MNDLSNKKIAILVTDGFEQVEMTEPREALQGAGAEAVLISPTGEDVRGWQHTDWGDSFSADMGLDQARADQFDGLVLPGGVMNPDKLRINPKAVQFVQEFFKAGKPVAAICHGLWPLVDAGVLKGRRVTSYPSLRADLTNAGALWVDQEVVVDNGLVTSRTPDDLPAFNAKMIEEFAEGIHSMHAEPTLVAARR